MERGAFRFGPFELDLRSRELRNGPHRVRLQEQPFEILRLLLERPGKVVTREDLRQRLWPEGTFVDFEHSLNAAVKRLRAVLGDAAEHPRFVETLPRRGYRFMAKVEADSEPGRPDPSPRVRLAVLPFSNLSEDSSQEFFSDGLTEEMIAQLGTLCRGTVGVVARWSSMAFKGSVQRAREIGELLRVDYLLEGSVRREGDRVRITARLVETTGETHLWSETYDRPTTDYLAVQADVAARTARSLALELMPDAADVQARAPNAAAHQAYLKGRYYWNKADDDAIGQAIAYFAQALQMAPTFGAAHAALARAHIARGTYYEGVPRDAVAAGRASATQALDLDRRSSEAYVALADATRILDWNWSAAETAYAHALAVNPSSECAHRSYAVMLTALGRHTEAVREVTRASELDPLCLVTGSAAAWLHYAAGDHAAAMDHCRYTLDLDPQCVSARRLLGAAYLLSGRDEEAVTELEKAVALAGDDAVALTWLAHAKAVTGDRRAALALVARVEALAPGRYVSGYHLGLAYAGLANHDAAFEALDRAWLDRDPALAGIAVEPRFSPVRTDARYERLLDRIHIPAAPARRRVTSP
jgi:TolB-like protein/Tfp pilus assembly protein PilF